LYSGVPKAIVSDNLKTTVSKASKYKPSINHTFKEFAQHYIDEGQQTHIPKHEKIQAQPLYKYVRLLFLIL
jgi:hypothetical protein